MSPRKKPSLTIRRARRTDAAPLAELSGQLGYPVTVAATAPILRKLQASQRDAVFVADSAEHGVFGWVHVSVNHLIEVGTRAEINGLIVADGHRTLGAGARLLDAAEAWARKHGAREMSVRSKVERERAHKFYERQGYQHYKTQKAFRKPI
jgi:GNAT superfamily N-acetyltransferase